MPVYDASRMADIDKLSRKISDKSTPDWERKRAEEALYAIKHQAQFSSIRKLRDRMTTAVRNGDREAAERIAEEGKRIDRDYQ